MKKGWLIFNGGLNSKKFLEMNNWYKNSANKKGIFLELVKNNEVFSLIENNESEIKTNCDICKPDFILFIDKDIRLAKHLENLGYRLYNSAKTIEFCDDKILTHQVLSNNNVRMPKTIFSPMMFFGTNENNSGFVDFVENKLGYPLVVKEAFGSFGAEVYLVKNRKELLEKRKELLYKPHLYQEFINYSAGKDVRFNVVGDKVVATTLRTSETDFRANVTNGGKMHKFKAEKTFEDLAVKVSILLGADFSGVDILFGENDEPIICEVNSNAHLINIFNCTGIDVADYIFDYILEDLEKGYCGK